MRKYPLSFGHVGPYEYLGALNPFQIASRPSSTGVPFGTMEGGRPFYMNLEEWQMRGLTGGKSVQFLGDRDCGKTAAAKVYAYRSATFKVGNTGYRVRPSTDDTRANAGEGEYKLWATALRSPYTDLSRYSLNILDPNMGMTIGEQTPILRSALEMSGRAPLTNTERLVLGAITSIANAEYGRSLTHNHVGLVVSSMKPNEYRKYLMESSRRRHVSDSGSAKRSATDARLGDFTNISDGYIKKACIALYEKFEILVEEYGEVFGGEHSMYSLLSQPAVALDFTNLDENALALVEMLFWAWRNAAVRRHDHTLMAHVEIHDENWKRWQSEVWGRNMVAHLKKIRGSGATVIKNMHRPSDIEQVGDDDSVERGQALTGLRETDVWLIGKMPRSEFEHLSRYVRLPEDKLNRLPMADKGEFVVVIGDGVRVKPFTIYLNDLTRTEKVFIESNQALMERMGV